MKILFVNLSALRFTVATPLHEPLGGSESALCYLALALAQRGHAVALTANLPAATPPQVDGVAHYPLTVLPDARFWETHFFDVIILCNAPAAAAPVRAFAPNARIILWAHILPDQSALQSLAQTATQQAMDHIVCVSAWQKQQIEMAFGALPKAVVIGNGIAPCFEDLFASVDDLVAVKQDCAVYASTPFRGLEVLVRAMRDLQRPTRLDVFSSMRVYQSHDENYAALFAQARKQEAIICHGAVTQAELAEYFRTSAFLFYPCIFPETFCITVAEAMAAGMHIITTDIGALSETTQNFATRVPLRSDKGEDLVDDFRTVMQQSIDQRVANPSTWAARMFAQSRAANAVFRWVIRAQEWEALLTL